MAEAAPHKISTITAGFMITVALVLDLLQFLLTIFVITALLAELVTFLALCIFGVWFAIMRVNFFSGRKTFQKVISAFGSAFVELVPLLDGLPGITMGVIGVIAGTRAEERSQKPKTAPSAANRVRFMPHRVPGGVNDNTRAQEQEAA